MNERKLHCNLRSFIIYTFYASSYSCQALLYKNTFRYTFFRDLCMIRLIFSCFYVYIWQKIITFAQYNLTINKHEQKKKRNLNYYQFVPYYFVSTGNGSTNRWNIRGWQGDIPA